MADAQYPSFGEYIKQAKGRDEATRMMGKKGKRPLDKLQAVGASALDVFTLGAGPPTIDRWLKGGYDTGRPVKDALANMALGSLPMLEPLISGVMGTKQEQGPVEQWSNRVQTENPEAAFVGSLLSSIPAGGAASLAGRTAARAIGDAGIPYLSKLVQGLVRTPVGRGATATATGSGAGGYQSYAEDQDPLSGALVGGATSLVGQGVVGEALPFSLNVLGGSDQPQRAAVLAMNKAGEGIGYGPQSGRTFPYEEVLAERQRLGPEATLMDANIGFRELGRAMVGSGEARPYAQNILYRHNPDAPRNKEIALDFETEATNALAEAVRTRTGVSPGRPSSFTAFKQETKAKREALQPQWTEMFKNDTNIYNADDILSRIGQATDFRSSTTQVANVEDQISKTIDRLSDRRRLARGQAGAPGEVPPARELNAEDLHTIREELDDMAGDAFDAKKTKLARRIWQARDEVNNMLIDTVPRFGQLNAPYSQTFSEERAYAAANNAFRNNNLNADDLALVMERASPADLPALMEGATAGILDKIDDNPQSLTTARNFVRNRRTQEKLTQMFGREATDILTEAAEKALTFKSTQQYIAGGSATNLRDAAAKELENLVNKGLVATGLAKAFGVGSLAGIAPGTAGTAGATLREAREATTSQRRALYPMLDTWLSGTGAQADENLMQMRRLAEEWYPSTSVKGRGFMEQPTSLMDSLLRTNLGQTPAFSLGIAASQGMQDERNLPR